jgi:hypothetical protein
MKTNIISLVICIIFLFPASLDAQVGKLLKKKLQEATQTAADEKKDEKDASPGKALMGLLGGGDAAYDQRYDFEGRIVLEMTVYDDNNAEESIIDYYSYFNETTGNAAIEVKPVSGDAAQSGMSVMTMVFDQKNQSAVMLSSQGEQKTAIITSMDIDEELYDEEVDESYIPEYNKTGRTRTISGYKCEEYKYTEEESSTSMWITNDLHYKVDRTQMKKAGIPVWYGGKDGMGMMIEMESFENDRLVMKMVVKDIDMTYSKAVSVDGYMIMNVGEGY